MTNDPIVEKRQAERPQAVQAKQEPEGDEGGEEEYVDEGAFPGQNPGRAVILPDDPQGNLDLQGYVEGRLPEPEATPQ